MFLASSLPLSLLYMSPFIALVSFYFTESLAVLVSAIIPIFIAAITIVAFLNGFFMILQGFFVRADHIPDYWIWGHYWSYQKYSFEAMVKTGFTGIVFNCPDCFCYYPSDLNADCKFRGEVSTFSRKVIN
jgi:ABC-type multidrug transport system permease subunit